MARITPTTIYCNVALFTRAWIEISVNIFVVKVVYVALFTRAWIEIKFRANRAGGGAVALFTRAWIEIDMGQWYDIALKCRPLYEGVD